MWCSNHPRFPTSPVLIKARHTSALLPTPSPSLLRLCGLLVRQSPVLSAGGSARVPPELWDAHGGRQRRRRAQWRWEPGDGGSWGCRSWASQRAAGHSPSSSGSALLLNAFKAEGGGQAVNGDPMGGLAAPPTHPKGK